ncbi:NUDIX hydrolase [Aestuariispira insulae]|uniref:ADP-ribose pyrophosphatase YjhB (NUDIX family) n=1 Tax=Aestuariispira insulae TaxID=1461337 RepID=A0A3D9HI49_9PROT|nr:NUDIX hydrolase [Aestuariispira insulae]RED49114.1 ADP-ribose pyrophosphatase YjhB (NUDIX family) [Aestuariispira insulae]
MPLDFSRPVIGVGVVVLKDDQVLLIRRKNPPEAGHWSLPGGKQDAGETIRETAAREVMEETGITITPPILLDVVDSIHHAPGGQIDYHYTLIDFQAEWQGGNPVPGDDALDAQWVALDEIGKLGLWKETLRVIRLAHARSQGR